MLDETADRIGHRSSHESPNGFEEGSSPLPTKKYPKAAEVIKTRKIMATMNLKVRLIRKRKKDLNRLIDAVRFLCHVVSGDFIGPGPTSSADLSEFTPSAFSLIAIGIPEILEDFGIRPDLLERFFSHISTVEFEIAAGLNLTDMGDETEGDASQTSPGHGIQSIFFRSDLFSFFFCPLPENAVIVRSTGGLELKRNLVSLFVKPVKGFFIIQGRDFLISEVLFPFPWEPGERYEGRLHPDRQRDGGYRGSGGD